MLMRQIGTQLFTYNTTDMEDIRRRRLLSVMLVGVFVIALLSLIVTLAASVAGGGGSEVELQLLLFGSVGTLIGVSIVYLINRFGQGWIASVLFLTLLTLVIAFSDEPQQVAVGRSLFLFVIPVFVASALLRPFASFLFAALVSLIVAAVGLTVDIVPSIASTSGFFMIALISWLAGRSLERALIELRIINQELDQRVAQRTQDLQEALARVQTESSKNQAILESIADGVIVFDQLGRAIVANPSITQLLNRPIEQIVSADLPKLMGEDVDRSDRDKVIHLFKDDEAHSPSFKFRWGSKTLSTSLAAVRDGSDKPIGHVMVCRDFTRETELDRMKSAFLSMASHEIRTPLNAILGYSDMLHEEIYGNLNEEQLKTLERIIANAKRMLGLVNNLLDQAQIEAGKISVQVEAFELHNLIEELKTVTTVLADNKGLELTYEVEPNVPKQITNDMQRLHQIILNLIGNAIKFTKKGSVKVRVFLPDAQHWAISVSDTGPGIPPDAQNYIFDAFRQVDDPSTREHIGSGLGLSIVKQLTTMLGGDVHLQSVVGQGSTFTITFPFQPVQEAIA